VAGVLGIDSKDQDARLVDLNGDALLDLVAVTRSSLKVRYGTGDHRFSQVVYSKALTAGRAVGVGESNGDGRPDLYIVQSQQDPTLPNPPDLMLLSTQTGWTQFPIPETSKGCGAAVSVLDYDGNGLDDYLVSNGARGVPGPTQLISFH
jgi:FG-GAP-like repeat